MLLAIQNILNTTFFIDKKSQSLMDIYILVSEFLKEGCKYSGYCFSSLPYFIFCQTYCQQFKAALVVSACHHDIAQACSLLTSIMGRERSPESERKTPCVAVLQLGMLAVWFCGFAKSLKKY